MPLPEWMQTAGRVVGNVAALPLNILGAVAGIQPQPAPGEWRYPERREQALRLIPETLPIGEQMQRLEMFRLQPYRDWPDLKLAYDKLDRDNAQLMQTPEYQALYAQGGPAGLQAFGYPQPPQVLAAQDAPLSAEARARGETAPSLPFRVPQAILPPVPPEELVKRFNAETQLDAMRRAGAEGGVARATLAGVPPELADAAGMVDAFTQLAQSRGFVAEPTIDKGGVSVKLSRPGQTAFESGMGTKRSTFTPLGGGGGASTGGGTVGQPSPQGKVYDLGNGQFALEDGTLVDRPPSGVTPTPATTEPAPAAPAAPPMRGQDSLAIENYPDATAADFQLLQERQQNALKLEYEQQRAEMEAKIKGRQLNENERTKIAKIAAARSFLNVFEQYGLEGQRGTGATETFPSSLPDTRIRGTKAAAELLRQSVPVQTLARDPFLQGFRRYQSIARPIIARNLGDDTGNLSETEQAAAAAMAEAASKPELRDAVQQMRAIIDERERALLQGKEGGGAAPDRVPRISPEEAAAELRRRGVPGY